MAEIPPEILAHMLETKGTLGRIEASQENTHKFLVGVNSKVDDHIKDSGAHGAAERDNANKSSDRKWNTWGTTIMAGGAFFDLLWRVFHKSPRGP